MADQQHLDLLTQGAEIWNEWRTEHSEVQPDLRRANLSGMNLSGAQLSFALSTNASFRKANLQQAQFTGAILRNTDFSKANLQQAQFTGAILRNTNFTEANLFQANLSQALLSRATLDRAFLHETILREADLVGASLREIRVDETDFSLATMYGTDLTNVDLKRAHGLETVLHQGPSRLGLHTIVRSHGHLPEPFLRGTEVPGTFMAVHAEDKCMEYPTCIIGYASADRTFVDRLQTDLQTQGILCQPLSYTPWSDTIHKQFVNLFCEYNYLLLVVSENTFEDLDKISFNDSFSETGHQAIYSICKLSMSRKFMPVFSILLHEKKTLDHRSNDALFSMFPLKDFVRWSDPDAYQQGFHQLLRDLGEKLLR